LQTVAYRRYLLTVLLIIQAHNYVDRQALGLVLQSIKVDLHLSDTELGLLTGIPFAIFYSVVGIPIARWADQGNRVGIIALSVGIWSVLVALCGRATSFAQLLILRAGIGVGEAGCLPPAQSLITDSFSRAERPAAMSTYMLGGPLSTLVGVSVAGWLNEFYGWRTMFILLGSPGLAMVPLAWFTLKEPRLIKGTEVAARTRGEDASSSVRSATARPPLAEVARTLWGNRTFRYLLFAFWVQYFLAYGVAQFQPAFLMRTYDLRSGTLGTLYALVFGLSSLVGLYSGGRLASRYANRNDRLQLQVAAATFVVYALTSALAYLSNNLVWAFTLLAFGTLVVNLATGSLWATAQSLVPAEMRATSSAGIFLFANLFGVGLGPLAVGALSDALMPWLGSASLRSALLIACTGYLFGTWSLVRASKTVRSDLQRAQENVLAS
jgi:MFS family permease